MNFGFLITEGMTGFLCISGANKEMGMNKTFLSGKELK